MKGFVGLAGMLLVSSAGRASHGILPNLVRRSPYRKTSRSGVTVQLARPVEAVNGLNRLQSR